MQAGLHPRARALLMLVGLGVAAALLLRGAFVLVAEGPRPRGEVVVGSKAFTESIILGEIVAEWLEKNGVPVERRFNLGGTQICFEALRSGKIDVYPEYTGTALLAILHHSPVADPAATSAEVRRALASQYDLAWLDPLGFNNSYALAMPRALAQRLGVRQISDLKAHPDLRPGFASEFLAREDGWPGLAARYHLAFTRPPVSMEAGLMYQAAIAGQVDLVSAYSTDGRIETANLVVLMDDERFFPPYDAALVVRREVLSPTLARLFGALHGSIGEAEMRRMNLAVDSAKRTPEDIAREFIARLRSPL